MSVTRLYRAEDGPLYTAAKQEMRDEFAVEKPKEHLNWAYAKAVETRVELRKAKALINRLVKSAYECKAQTHYFMCHSVNMHPGMTDDDGDCRSGPCMEAREVIVEARGEPWPTGIRAENIAACEG